MPHRSKISMGKRKAVYIRDGWSCQYCGRVFTPTADDMAGRSAPMEQEFNEKTRWTDLVWLELDHIVPCSLGGDDSIENLRAACTPCNKRKLATTRHTDWGTRIRLAREVLDAGSSTEETARAAAALLLGYLKSELPPVRGRHKAVAG